MQFFSHTVDRLLDIQQAIGQVANWCGDDLRKLAALYYVTTSVSQVDAGRIAGLPIYLSDGRWRCQSLRRWIKQVLHRLQETLQLYQPLTPNRHAWREQIKQGNTQPVQALAIKYADDPFKLLSLYVLTTRVARDTIVRELGVNDSKLWYATKQLRHELRCMYASRLPT